MQVFLFSSSLILFQFLSIYAGFPILFPSFACSIIFVQFSFSLPLKWIFQYFALICVACLLETINNIFYLNPIFPSLSTVYAGFLFLCLSIITFSILSSGFFLSFPVFPSLSVQVFLFSSASSFPVSSLLCMYKFSFFHTLSRSFLRISIPLHAGFHFSFSLVPLSLALQGFRISSHPLHVCRVCCSPCKAGRRGHGVTARAGHT